METIVKKLSLLIYVKVLSKALDSQCFDLPIIKSDFDFRKNMYFFRSLLEKFDCLSFTKATANIVSFKYWDALYFK